MKLWLITLLKLSLWTLLFIVIDINLRISINFLFEEQFLRAHAFRELLILRCFEFLTILILMHNTLMSIFGEKSRLIKEIFFSLLLAFTSILLAGLTQFILKKMGIDLFSFFRPKDVSDNYDWELLAIAVILGPFIEEICFRGLIWNSLKNSFHSPLNTSLGILLCAIPFTFLHLNFNHPINYQFGLIGMWFICAIITLFLFNWRKSIWMGFSLHASANFVIYFSHHLNL